MPRNAPRAGQERWKDAAQDHATFRCERGMIRPASGKGMEIGSWPDAALSTMPPLVAECRLGAPERFGRDGRAPDRPSAESRHLTPVIFTIRQPVEIPTRDGENLLRFVLRGPMFLSITSRRRAGMGSIESVARCRADPDEETILPAIASSRRADFSATSVPAPLEDRIRHYAIRLVSGFGAGQLRASCDLEGEDGTALFWAFRAMILDRSVHPAAWPLPDVIHLLRRADASDEKQIGPLLDHLSRLGALIDGSEAASDLAGSSGSALPASDAA